MIAVKKVTSTFFFVFSFYSCRLVLGEGWGSRGCNVRCNAFRIHFLFKMTLPPFELA